MAQSHTTKPDAAFQLKHAVTPNPEADSMIHSLGNGHICDTESRGHSTPKGKSVHEIVVDASEGFIPLWAKNTTLRWRFRERSMINFANPAAAKNAIRNLLGEALTQWGTAAPVKFKEDKDVWDFEIAVKNSDECSASGCVLASAFFPDPGRHELTIYPIMFNQPREEQVETLIHEIGHVFGLRHFFAKELERGFPSEIFGVHSKFSIMNYGTLSKLTENDKKDLKNLYKQAWSRALTHINGTPIKFVKPFHTFATVADGAFTLREAAAAAVAQPVTNDEYISEIS
ncbi:MULTISPECIES: matrixin family metalloprotease [Niastella]|uniref:Peptidase M10 metallopeptidase domain-containing protein n=1 Tax=Niastella soli TaxID=2821487 RepID=A0ABS3YX03_9BACT|nr:matrixin family metalloprotease [Niastella soli]MBO9202398.1 hypothetical protein [Niastella soli]